MNLFEQADAREIAQASREAWDHVSLTLAAREIAVFRALHELLSLTGRLDATGGELAAAMRLPITSVRPRLHGLERKHWITRGAIRPSSAGERRCHPYCPALPLGALSRLESTCTL